MVVPYISIYNTCYYDRKGGWPMKSYISIKNILERKHFEEAEIVAGEKGLGHQIKWVHVVESIQINNLLKGSELILSTGLGWKEKPEQLFSFVKQLIDCHAAGLCIEMNTYIKDIPQNVIELADSYQFPIILFHKEVLFVEITHDIHSLIINNQYQLLSDLEQYSQILNKMIIEIDQHRDVLSFLQKYLEVQVFAVFHSGKIESFPNMTEKLKQQVLNRKKAENNERSITKPVQILGDTYAEVTIVSTGRRLNDFDSLILDRTTTVLGQFWLRDLYVNEKRMDSEKDWLTDWIEGELREDVLVEQLSKTERSTPFTGAVVWVCKVKDLTVRTVNKEFTYFKLMTRTVFEQFGFHLYFVETKQHIVVISLDKRKSDSWKQRMIKAFQRIQQYDSYNKNTIQEIPVGVGQYVKKNLMNINKSYHSAKETLELQEFVAVENKSMFYQDLHLYRMLTLLKNQGNLEETVYEYLEPVIEYDRKYNCELLSTLKVYMECNGSKQETSKRLFIVRQTLYHRIEKLEAILGGNFMNSKKRLELEFMLVAYDYLTTHKKEMHLKSPVRL